MFIFKHPKNSHLIVTDKRNKAEIWNEKSKLEKIEKGLNQLIQEGKTYLLCELGLEVLEETEILRTVMSIPQYTDTLVITEKDVRNLDTVQKWYKIKYCPLYGKELKVF